MWQAFGTNSCHMPISRFWFQLHFWLSTELSGIGHGVLRPLQGNVLRQLHLFVFDVLRRAFESSGGKENPDSRCVANSHVLVVANEATSLRSGENTVRLEGFSRFIFPSQNAAKKQIQTQPKQDEMSQPHNRHQSKTRVLEIC
jgi:hypothetical protein